MAIFKINRVSWQLPLSISNVMGGIALVNKSLAISHDQRLNSIPWSLKLMDNEHLLVLSLAWLLLSLISLFDRAAIWALRLGLVVGVAIISSDQRMYSHLFYTQLVLIAIASLASSTNPSPAWLKRQVLVLIGLVYFFGGLSKMNIHFISGETAQQLVALQNHLALGKALSIPYMAMVFSVIAVILELVLAANCFHFRNARFLPVIFTMHLFFFLLLPSLEIVAFGVLFVGIQWRLLVDTSWTSNPSRRGHYLHS